MSDSKHFSFHEQSMLHDVLTKFEFFSDGAIGTCKTKPVDIELHLGVKSYQLKWDGCAK